MESNCLSLKDALLELDQIAPGAPLLALGQTVLWDEPMKGGAALALREIGSNRKLVAGVHDTDFFAKLPSGTRERNAFKAFPHNDTTTRGLWSAAGEFRAIFGSETVISKQELTQAGARLEKLARARPGVLDEATEAFGWRGIVSLDQDAPLAGEVSILDVFDPLQKTLDWAIESTIEAVGENSRPSAIEKSNELWTTVCNSYAIAERGTLTDFYCDLLPSIYNFVAGEEVPLEVTRTSRLLQFNNETCNKDHFKLLDLFLQPESRERAVSAYNSAVEGTEVYQLERFGTGAIPFDLVVPGHGRGTIRIGKRGLVIAGANPLFASFKKPINSVSDLAEIIERKFGPSCVIIGKAITLIGMLATEFVFVFHEGASGYTKQSMKFHDGLIGAGFGLKWNPILRIRYCPWTALDALKTWIHLPKPLQMAFGTEDVCAASFSSRWEIVAQEQTVLLAELSELRRPVELIHFLDQHVGGAWSALAKEYETIHERISGALAKLQEEHGKRMTLYGKLRLAKSNRVESEMAKGDHFRETIFEKMPSSSDLEMRHSLTEKVVKSILEINYLRMEIEESVRRQRGIASSKEIELAHERRRSIELEAELKRVQLIRNAIISSKGLLRAGYRPSAWWFPLLSPNGDWIRRTWETSQCYFESLGQSPNESLTGTF